MQRGFQLGAGAVGWAAARTRDAPRCAGVAVGGVPSRRPWQAWRALPLCAVAEGPLALHRPRRCCRP